MRGDSGQRIRRELRHATAPSCDALPLQDAAILLNQRRDFVHQLLPQPQIGILLGWVCDGVPDADVGVGVDF